jgi:hypothetical protein
MTNEPQIQGLVGKIENDVAWLRTHFFYALLFVAVVLGSVYGAVRLVNGIITDHDEKKDQQLNQILAADKANQAAFMARLTQDEQTNALRDQQQNEIVKSLISQMAAQHAATEAQVKKDATLNAADAAIRLTTQEKAQPGQAVANGDTVVVDLPLTRQIVSDLDKYAQAQSDAVNLGGQLAAQKILTDDAKQNFENAQKVINSDKDTLIAQIKTDAQDCKVQVDKERAKGEKRSLWSAVVGIVTGFLLHR